MRAGFRPSFLGGLPKAAILSRFGLLPFLNFNETLELGDGKTLRIPMVGRTGFCHRYPHELWLDKLLSTLISRRPGTAFIDAGVNLGQTTVKLIKLGFRGPYIGFEPNPSCVSFINNMLRINGIKDYRVIPLGLSSRSGITNLFVSSDDDSTATVLDGFRDHASKHRISAGLCRLDDIARDINLQRVGIIKIDVEGAELDVIEGARETLSEHMPFVICEVLPVYRIEQNPERFERQTKLVSIMSGLGYSLYRVDHKTAALEPLSQIEVHSDLERCDYLFADNARTPEKS
jgi:FkbM family methyltransferase